MALALCISAPCFISRRHQAQPGLILPLWSCRVNFRSSRRLGIRCDAGEPPAPVNAPRTASDSSSPSWAHSEPSKDAYAGWGPVDKDEETPKRAGFFKIGAGIVLALAFSLASYTAYSRGGFKNAVSYSVTTLERGKDLLTGSEKSQDAHHASDSDISGKGAADDSKQDVRGEDPQQPDVASAASGLQQKEAAPGQDSFPTKDVEEHSDDEVNALSTTLLSDSDVDSSDEFAHNDVVIVKDDTPRSEELEHPINESNPVSNVKGNGDLSADVDTFNVDSKDSPHLSSPDLFELPPDESDAHESLTQADKPSFDESDGHESLSQAPEPSFDESDGHESPSQTTSDLNVLENEKEQSDENSVDHPSSADSASEPGESSGAEAKPQAGLSADPNEETVTVSASLVLPKGAADGVLEMLGLDSESGVGELDPSALEPGQMQSFSVVETLSSPSPSPGSEFWQMESVEYFGIPAPSAPSAHSQSRPWSVVVPATVDHDQEQALAALQALKVIEPDVEAGGICTRREYARWLIAVTGTLARSPARKVLPAMYIDSVSELAFNDVVPEDPDFPYIQGLAEAGLISSNLSRHDADQNGRSTDGSIFFPDSSLCRQDLVTWRVALEGSPIQAVVDKQKLKAQTGFIDFDRINEDALPFLARDLAAGEGSIMSTTFGFTRRFQPAKPVTRGQAAIALVTGEAAEAVAEELTRQEAEDAADAAVVAELALEGRARKYLDEYFDTELKVEKESRLATEKQLEQVKTELGKVVNERDDQRVSLESIQAAVQAERDLLHTYRRDLDEQIQALTRLQLEAEMERDKLATLRKEASEGGETLAEKKAEVEVEKRALILTRLWAEDEAKKARAHAKVLEEARNRWEGKGIQVRVDKELDGESIPALGWQYSGPKTKLNKFLQRPPVHDILEKAGDLKSRVVERFFQLLEIIRRALISLREKIVASFHVVKEKGAKSLQGAGKKAHVIQQDTFSVVSRKAQEVKDATGSTLAGASSNVSKKAQEVKDATGSTLAGASSTVSKKAQEVKDATGSTLAGASSTVSKKAQEVKDATGSTLAGASSTVSRKAQEVKDATASTVAGASSNVAEGTRKMADGFRGEAQKIAGKFKS